MKNQALVLSYFFLIFILLIQIFLENKPFLSITEYYSYSDIFGNFQSSLKKEKPLFGSFKAKEDFMGVINIQFNPFAKNDGDIAFTLKEQNNHYIIENKVYAAIQFKKLPFYPFGIPIINNSKDNKYTLELILQKGKNEDVIVDKTYPSISIQYFWPKDILLNNPMKIVSFVLNKFVFSLKRPDILFLFSISFIPILALIMVKIINRKLLLLSYSVLALLILSIIADIILINVISIWSLFSMFAIILALVINQIININDLTRFLIVLLLLLLLFFMLNNELYIQKVSAYIIVTIISLLLYLSSRKFLGKIT